MQSVKTINISAADLFHGQLAIERKKKPEKKGSLILQASQSLMKVKRCHFKWLQLTHNLCFSNVAVSLFPIKLLLFHVLTLFLVLDVSTEAGWSFASVHTTSPQTEIWNMIRTGTLLKSLRRVWTSTCSSLRTEKPGENIS